MNIDDTSKRMELVAGKVAKWITSQIMVLSNY